MSAAKMSMKLLVDKSKNKVVFAEAGKESVDFLLHVLALPLGTVVGYLTKDSMVGSLGRLYASLESLDSRYLQDGFDKGCLLDPKPPHGSAPLRIPTLSPKVDQSVGTKKSHGYATTYYTCDQHFNFSDALGVKCSDCKVQMKHELKYVSPPRPETGSRGGYVKDVMSYMIMDDLSVQPSSGMLSVALLNKIKVHEVACLEEREVNLDINVGMALLKASLMSITVLSDVFLAEKSE